MKILLLNIVFIPLFHSAFSQNSTLNSPNETEVLNNSSAASINAIKGVLTGEIVGVGAKSIIAQNNGVSIFGIGAWGNHAAGGIGVRSNSSLGIGSYGTTNTGVGIFSTSSSLYGIRSSSNSLSGIGMEIIATGGGSALEAVGQPTLTLSNSTEALGKVLLCDDNSGKVRWDEYILYTLPITATNPRDTTIDGNNLKILNLSVPCLTQSVVDKGEILVYMQIPGGEENFPLPYSSNAGGVANTLSFIPQADKKRILITRYTYNNSGSIGVSSSLKYRLVIMPKKGLY